MEDSPVLDAIRRGIYECKKMNMPCKEIKISPQLYDLLRLEVQSSQLISFYSDLKEPMIYGIRIVIEKEE